MRILRDKDLYIGPINRYLILKITEITIFLLAVPLSYVKSSLYLVIFKILYLGFYRTCSTLSNTGIKPTAAVRKLRSKYFAKNFVKQND